MLFKERCIAPVGPSHSRASHLESKADSGGVGSNGGSCPPVRPTKGGRKGEERQEEETEKRRGGRWDLVIIKDEIGSNSTLDA